MVNNATSTRTLISELSQIANGMGMVSDNDFDHIHGAVERQLIQLKADIGNTKQSKITKDFDNLNKVSKKFVKICKSRDFTPAQLDKIQALKDEALQIRA